MMDEEEGKTVDSDWSTEDEGEEGGCRWKKEEVVGDGSNLRI